MAGAKPHIEAERPAGAKEPIGQVSALVYDWKPGQVEIQVQFPRAALWGASGAAEKQERFRELVIGEL